MGRSDLFYLWGGGIGGGLRLVVDNWNRRIPEENRRKRVVVVFVVISRTLLFVLVGDNTAVGDGLWNCRNEQTVPGKHRIR